MTSAGDAVRGILVSAGAALGVVAVVDHHGGYDGVPSLRSPLVGTRDAISGSVDRAFPGLGSGPAVVGLGDLASAGRAGRPWRLEAPIDVPAQGESGPTGERAPSGPPHLLGARLRPSSPLADLPPDGRGRCR